MKRRTGTSEGRKVRGQNWKAQEKEATLLRIGAVIVIANSTGYPVAAVLVCRVHLEIVQRPRCYVGNEVSIQ